MNVTYFDPNQAHAAENALPVSLFQWRYVSWGASLAVLVLSIVYLVMLNGLATQGFDMESLKAAQLDLHKEVEALEIALAIPSSLYALESNELIQSLPEVKNKNFLEIKRSDLVWLES